MTDAATSTEDKPFPHHYFLWDFQRWGHQSKDAKWIEVWQHDMGCNKPNAWTTWYVYWLYNPHPYQESSRWAVDGRVPEGDHDRYIQWWGRWPHAGSHAQDYG